MISRSRFRLALLLGAVMLLGGLGAALLAAPAQADVPAVEATVPFSAGLCEGTTNSDPRATGGAISDLTRVFGQRLTDYNAGGSVPLYGNSGGQGGAPSCGLRYVEGDGNVLEWMYCTDFASEYCTAVAGTGEVTQRGKKVGSLEDLDGNARLSEEQELAINFIVHHDLELTAPMPNGGVATTASNDTTNTRTARQYLVWCVSDRAAIAGPFGGWCDDNVGTDGKRILDLIPAEPKLSLEPAPSGVRMGDTARLTLSTNLFRQSITLATGGPVDTVELCDPTEGTIDGSRLVVDGDDGHDHVDVDLCVTSGAAGEAQVAASAEPVGPDTVSWVQSPGTADITCQVYAYTVRGEAHRIATSARFDVTATGGFRVVKEIAGDGASSVPADAEFTVEFAAGDAAPVELEVPLDEAGSVVSGLPAGASVTMSEVDLPQVVGVTWSEPSFVVDGVEQGPTATFMIVDDATTQVVLTNTAHPEVVPVDGGADEPQESTPVDDDTSEGGPVETRELVTDTAQDDEQVRALPVTGAGAAVVVSAVVAVLLLLGGATLLVACRRRRATA
ncbi:DUF5979 domain-containing protein [Isoptericola sp. NEAU-Y5]|uniref:DUF5979 domain-containing protein n=1 Tax=Isoptericola luteus TaxID=2879484 RepID=A0ABS7ZGJ9_9MICO|nr:DUF5979 domain-containing protein [Isoptericola sp. NEAU-Y5]MCA5892940.1 DUF5979 domain-containing protein [Isoptericola sp. NEAU-Y5]